MLGIPPLLSANTFLRARLPVFEPTLAPCGPGPHGARARAGRIIPIRPGRRLLLLDLGQRDRLLAVLLGDRAFGRYLRRGLADFLVEALRDVILRDVQLVALCGR